VKFLLTLYYRYACKPGDGAGLLPGVALGWLSRWIEISNVSGKPRAGDPHGGGAPTIPDNDDDIP